MTQVSLDADAANRSQITLMIEFTRVPLQPINQQTMTTKVPETQP